MEIDDFVKNNAQARQILRNKSYGLPKQPKNYICLNCSNGFDEPVVQNKILKIIALLLLLFCVPIILCSGLFLPHFIAILLLICILILTATIFWFCAFKKTCPHCKSNNIKKDRLR